MLTKIKSKFLGLIVRSKLEKYIFDFNLRSFFSLLRYLTIILILPAYWFYWFIYKFIIALYNKYPRAVFTEYTVKRKDNYFVMTGCILIFISFFIFFVSLQMEVINQFWRWIAPKLNLEFNNFEYYFNKLYLIYFYIKYWITKTSIIAIPFVLLDQIILKRRLKVDPNRPASKLRKYFLREEAIQNDKTFLGITRDEKREGFSVSDEQFSTHLSGMATTGAGKTELFFSLAYQNMKKGRGVTVIDCKGDLEFAKKLYTFHKRYNPHNQKFKVINLADPDFSNTYNFLLRGSALEIKDRLVNAVEWSEQYYKNATIDVILTLLQAVIEELDKKITMKDLYLLMTEKKAVKIIQNMVDNDFISGKLQEIINDFEDTMKDCKGLINQINILCNSELGKIINHYNPEVDLFESYVNQEIVYITIPTNRLKETAKAFGRMLLSDLEATTSYIEENVPRSERRKYSITIDEFEAFATGDFVGWINKARSAKYNIQMFYQSEGDLETIDPAFVKQIIDNTNLKVAGRVNHPETAENFAKQVGTRKTVKETARVNKDLLRQMEGEMGSEREVEEFIVSPNEIRDLKIGQFVVLGKHPDNFKKIINVDYIPDPDFEELELVKEEKERVAEDKRLNMEELLKKNNEKYGEFMDSKENKEEANKTKRSNRKKKSNEISREDSKEDKVQKIDDNEKEKLSVKGEENIKKNNDAEQNNEIEMEESNEKNEDYNI